MLHVQLTFLVRLSTSQKLGDMEPLYIFTPGPGLGNCDQHKPLLQSCFAEAIDMVNRSINAINSLGVSLSQLDTSGERNSWKSSAQLLMSIFGIPLKHTEALDLNNADVTLVRGKSLRIYPIVWQGVKFRDLALRAKTVYTKGVSP